MNIKSKYSENGGKTNGGPTKAELKEKLKRLEIEKRKATVSRDLSGGLMFTQEEAFKDMAGLVNVSDKVAAQADKYYSDKIKEVKDMLEAPEFMGGGKMYVKYQNGGKTNGDPKDKIKKKIDELKAKGGSESEVRRLKQELFTTLINDGTISKNDDEEGRTTYIIKGVKDKKGNDVEYAYKGEIMKWFESGSNIFEYDEDLLDEDSGSMYNKKEKEFMGGGKMYVKKYSEGGKIKDDGDGPKFVVEGGSLKMVLGSGKTTDSWTADQLRRYLQDSGFLLQGGTQDARTMSGQTSAGKYNLGEAIGKYKETGDLSSIALLIDTNRPGFEDLIPGMDYSSVSKEAREEKGISETGFTGKRFLVRRREERERAEAGMSGMSQE